MLKKLLNNTTIFLIILILLVLLITFILFFFADNTANSNGLLGDSPIWVQILFMFGMFSIMVVISIIAYSILNRIYTRSLNPPEQFNFGTAGKSLPYINEINYCQEIPCNKDPIRAYWIAFQYSAIPMKTIIPGMIGAILLKWIKQKFISVVHTGPVLYDLRDFSLMDNSYAINLNESESTDDIIEDGLLRILKRAAGSNGILESMEFRRWCEKNYIIMETWFNRLIDYETSQLEQQKLITNPSKEVPGRSSKTKTILIKNVDPILKNEAIQLIGLKMFLSYKLIHKREHFALQIWKEYLIFAQFLGITDEVIKQFSELYSNSNQASKSGIEFAAITVNQIASSGSQGMRAGRMLAYNDSKQRGGSGIASGSFGRGGFR